MRQLPSIFIGFIALFTMNSCSNKFYTSNDFYSIEKIDAHIHLNCESNALVEQAKEDKFSIFYINVDFPAYPSIKNQFEYAATQHKEFTDKVNFIATFSMENWNSLDWANQTIEKLKIDFANGALGVKFWKNIGMVCKDSENHFITINNPKFDPVIAFIIKQNKVMLGHFGEPKNCWLPLEQMTMNSDREYFKTHPEYHMYLQTESPSYENQIDERDKFLERHPDLHFVGAHLGSLEWSVDELAKRLDKFPNMAVDMAARICHLQYQSMLDREKVREFIIKYQDRLLYATDFEIDSTSNEADKKIELQERWIKDWKYFATTEKLSDRSLNGEFTGLQLPKEVIDKIYYQNAVRWYKTKK